jgi:hypothetical protein
MKVKGLGGQKECKISVTTIKNGSGDSYRVGRKQLRVKSLTWPWCRRAIFLATRLASETSLRVSHEKTAIHSST